MRGAAAAASLAIACAAGAATGFAVSGCATASIRSEEIPDAPIAFIYFDAETARLRAEKLEEEMKQRGRGRPSQPGEAVAALDEVARFIERTFGVAAGPDKRLLGRMALLDPRSGEVTVVAGARKGAIPQDWSPDHERLLFSQIVHDGIPQLFEVDVARGDVRRMTYGRTGHPEGCYGPDGSIVFTSVVPSAKERNSRIMITDSKGDEPQPLSPAGYAYYPACAPDGSAVGYTAISAGGRVQRVEIRSPVRTGKPRVLARGKEPSFSADGRWIAFSARLKGEASIWRVRPDGTGRSSLGSSGLDEVRPSLSPDDRLIVYVADTKFHQQLYLRRVDGSGNRILLTDGGGDRPVW
jgi:Tol biopolymer transport system component